MICHPVHICRHAGRVTAPLCQGLLRPPPLHWHLNNCAQHHRSPLPVECGSQIVGSRLRSLRKGRLGEAALAREAQTVAENLDICLDLLDYKSNIKSSFELPAGQRIALFQASQDVQHNALDTPLELDNETFAALCAQARPEIKVYAYNWCLAKGPDGSHARLARSESGARVVCKNCWDALTRKLRKTVTRQRQETVPFVPLAGHQYSDQLVRCVAAVGIVSRACTPVMTVSRNRSTATGCSVPPYFSPFSLSFA